MTYMYDFAGKYVCLYLCTGSSLHEVNVKARTQIEYLDSIQV